MVACPQLLAEVEKAFSTRYFSARIDPNRRAGILVLMREAATMFPDPTDPAPELRDPKDDYVAALARDEGAEAIGTGHKDLLDHPGLMPPAITSREACERFDLP
jgi:predicted nucleic acid-binding protein